MLKKEELIKGEYYYYLNKDGWEFIFKCGGITSKQDNLNTTSKSWNNISVDNAISMRLFF